MKTSTVLPLLLLGAAGHGANALAQSGTFAATGRMTTPRAGHTATLLTNGKVLIAGGTADFTRPIGPVPIATAELYDPDTATFAPTGDMTAPRFFHTATLLPDGRVLFAGGDPGQGLTHSKGAEIYDPSTGTFAPTGNMIGIHVCHEAHLLDNGKVLVACR